MSRPGGVIRITELEILPNSTSPALTRLFELGLEALHRAGHFFTPNYDGVTGQLAHLLRKSGLQNVQTRAYTLHHRAGTTEGQVFYEDTKRLFRTLLPFFRKWTRVPEDYETIYQQALAEMQQPDFVATSSQLTVWGNKPE